MDEAAAITNVRLRQIRASRDPPRRRAQLPCKVALVRDDYLHVRCNTCTWGTSGCDGIVRLWDGQHIAFGTPLL